MGIYILIYVTILTAWVINRVVSVSEDTNDIWMIVVFFLFIYTATLRYGIGFDYHSYESIFYNIQNLNMVEMLQYHLEYGYVLLNKVVSLVGGDYRIFLFVTAMIINGLVFYVIKKHSSDVWLSILIYLCLQHFAFTMNLMRQGLAFAIVFFSYHFLVNREIRKYVITILIASSFHMSALIMLPFYYILQLKHSKKNIILISSVIIGIFINFDFFMGLLVGTFFEKYHNYIGSNVYWNGNSWKYLVFPIAIYGISYLPIIFKKVQIDDILMNYSYYTFVFSVMIAQHFILERLSIYFSIQLLILLPKTEKNRYLSLGVILVCTGYFIFGYMEGFHNVYPYYSMLDKL